MQDMPTIPMWLIPTFYGDVKLEATSETSCVVITTDLTPTERSAIGKLEALAKKKGWSVLFINKSGTTELKAPIAKVAKALNKLLKPDRTIVSAIRFSDGTMEEIRDSQTPSSTPSSASTTSNESATSPDGLPKATALQGTKAGKRGRKPKAATSVAAPVRGCPPPEFSQAEIRAQRVLKTFLTAEQIEDFTNHQRFISRGSETGRRYMLTSRHARGELAKYTRSLYDLDLQMPICAHDYDVPASEELLGFHVLLQLPGWESYLSTVTELNHHELLAIRGART